MAQKQTPIPIARWVNSDSFIDLLNQLFSINVLHAVKYTRV